MATDPPTAPIPAGYKCCAFHESKGDIFQPCGDRAPAMSPPPPTAPLPHGQPAAEKLCPHGTRYHYGDVFCVKCAAGRVFGEEVAPPAPSRPTFNHTREDSPLTPCPECAALLPREALLAAYENQRIELGNVYAQLAKECAAKHEARRALEDLKAAGSGTPETPSAGTLVGLPRPGQIVEVSHVPDRGDRPVRWKREAVAHGTFAGHADSFLTEEGNALFMSEQGVCWRWPAGDPLLVGLLPAGGQVGRVR